MKEEQRLMMSEEEVRERAKELLNMPREELLTNHLFLQQENKSLQSQLKAKEEVIKEAREYNQNIVDDYLKEDDCEYCDGRYATATHNLEILSKGENK